MRATYEKDLVITDGLWVDARAYGDSLNDTTLQAAITAIGSDDKKLVIAPGNWSITDDVTVPSNISLRVERGAVLQISTTKTLTINGSLEAGLYQIFDCVGTGSVRFGIANEVYPEWWTENVSPGTTDMSLAIQAAIDCRGTDSITVKLSETTYLIVTPVIINNSLTHIIGNGKQKTIIDFNPGLDDQTAFTFVRSGITNIGEGQVPTNNYQLVGCSFKNISFTGTSAWVKTAIKLVNIAGFDLHNCSLNTWKGTRSIGLHTKGSAFLSARNLDISLWSGNGSDGIPILIDVGPAYVTTGIDADHFNFHNIYLIAGDSYPCILGNAYGFWTNVSFTGYQAWVCGTHGINRTITGFTATGLSGTYGNVVFNNIRTEQGSSATSYSIRLEVAGLTEINNCYLDSTREGIYCSGGNTDSRLRISSLEYGGGAGRIGLNVDSGCRTVSWNNVFWQTNCTLTLTGHKLKYGTKSNQEFQYSDAVYTVPYDAAAETVSYDGTYLADNTSYFVWRGTLASAATQVITVGGTNRFYEITLMGYDETGNVLVGGKIIDYSIVDGTTVPIKLSGTANFAVTDAALSLCYLRAIDNMTTATIKNNLANSVDVALIIQQIYIP